MQSRDMHITKEKSLNEQNARNANIGVNNFIMYAEHIKS